MIPDASPDTCPALSAWDVHVPYGLDDERPAVRAWAAHLAAGRIGAAPADDPAQRARLARTEALISRRGRPGIW
jgi:hypothetical protein